MSLELRLGFVVQMAFGGNVREEMGYVGESRDFRAHGTEERDPLRGHVWGTVPGCSHWCHCLQGGILVNVQSPC